MQVKYKREYIVFSSKMLGRVESPLLTTRDLNSSEGGDSTKKKTVYTPEQLLAFEDNGTLPEGCELPDRSFYRFDATVLMKINSYLQNVNNGSQSLKKNGKRNSHRTKDAHHLFGGSNSVPSQSYRAEEEDNDEPEWMAETDFKVDRDFQLYMKSGSHTADDFEREKRLFRSKNNTAEAKSAEAINTSGSASRNTSDESTATDRDKNETSDEKLKKELQKQLEEPEILGPTEQEYYQLLAEKEKQKEAEARAKAQKPNVSSGDFQFGLEIKSKNQMDNFFTSLLNKNTENAGQQGSHEDSTEATTQDTCNSRDTTSSTIAHGLRAPLQCTGSQILPPGLDTASKLGQFQAQAPSVKETHGQEQGQSQGLSQTQPQSMPGMFPPGMLPHSQFNQPNHNSYYGGNQQSPSDMQMQQMKQVQMMQHMQQMQHMQRLQQLQQMQQPRSNLQNMPPNMSPNMPPNMPPNMANMPNMPNVSSVIPNGLNGNPNLSNVPANGIPNMQQRPYLVHTGLPPGKLDQLPPHVLQQLINSQQHSPQLPPGMQHPLTNLGNIKLNPNMNINNIRKQQLPQSPQENRQGSFHGSNQISPQQLPQNNSGNNVPRQMPPQMHQQTPPQMQQHIPPQMMTASLPPPDQLPSPFKEKFYQIQQILLHYQQNSQPPSPALLRDMMEFHKLLEKNFSRSTTGSGNPQGSTVTK